MPVKVCMMVLMTDGVLVAETVAQVWEDPVVALAVAATMAVAEASAVL